MVRTIHNGIGLMQIRYRITAADYNEANSRLMRSAQIFGAVIILAGALVGITNPQGVTQNPIPIIVAPVFGLFLIFGWRLSASRAYKADKRLQREYSATIGESIVEVECETGRTEYRWSSFVRFLETKNLFLLYQAPRVFNLFPKRSFSPGDAEAFRQLAKAKVVPAPQQQPNVVKTIVFWLVVILAAVLLWQVVKNTR